MAGPLKKEEWNNELRTKVLDFDLHGIVGIRLTNPTPSDIVAVEKQLGPIQAPLSRQPDIVIDFVDQIQLSSPIRYLGIDDVGFTDDAFLVFRGKQKAHVKVQIPFDQIGIEQCHVVCESGLPAVPLLMPILNLTVLSKGALPLHATAFQYNGKEILVTGWSKGGKTETLLAFAAQGAEYIGDEWVYISEDGQCMFGIPEPIRLWYWHLKQMPRYKSTVKRGTLARLQTLNLAVNTLEGLAAIGSGSGKSPFRSLRRASALLKQQLNIQVPPEKLFGKKIKGMSRGPQKVFFVASHADPGFTVQRVDPKEVAGRMVFSLQEERKDFMSYYLKYRFAFPERENPFIDQAEEIQHKVLLKVLEGKDSYAVYHPYPVSIPAMFEFIQPFCE